MQPIPAPTHTLIPPAVTYPTGTFAAQTRRMKAKARDACHSALRPPASSVSLLETRAPSCMHKGRDMTTCSLNMLHLFLLIITVMQLSLEYSTSTCAIFRHRLWHHCGGACIWCWFLCQWTLTTIGHSFIRFPRKLRPVPKKANLMVCFAQISWHDVHMQGYN